MKALSGLNDSALNLIFQERPFESLDDFMTRCPLNKTQMVSLIKSGAFDSFEKEWSQKSKIKPRILAMAYYLYRTSELKQKITLQNLNGLIQKKMIPDYLEHQMKIYLLNKKFKAEYKNEQYYILDPNEEKLITEEYDSDKISVINGQVCIFQKDWEKVYRIEMNIIKDWLADNQQNILDEYNQSLFLENWQKYANGSISAWEMDSLCFYYHEHELKNVNLFKYGISNFFNMPENPRVNYFIKRNNRQIPIYKLYRIIGTVIGKNDTRSSVSLLTLEGIVNVKFNKEYYAMYNRQISEVQTDGSKKILEKGWFSRGTKILCTGYRKDDTFIAKRYSNSPTHQLYKIIEVTKDGELTLVHNRTNQGEMEDE